MCYILPSHCSPPKPPYATRRSSRRLTLQITPRCPSNPITQPNPLYCFFESQISISGKPSCPGDLPSPRPDEGTLTQPSDWAPGSLVPIDTALLGWYNYTLAQPFKTWAGPFRGPLYTSPSIYLLSPTCYLSNNYNRPLQRAKVSLAHYTQIRLQANNPYPPRHASNLHKAICFLDFLYNYGISLEKLEHPLPMQIMAIFLHKITLSGKGTKMIAYMLQPIQFPEGHPLSRKSG